MQNQLWLEAPAKINLTLDVLKRRDDGYHDVEIILQSIHLSDVLFIERLVSGITLETDNADLPTDITNLAFQAAETILQGEKLGVHLYLHKNIPIAAGLAGGSTNAAAVLFGINRLLANKHSVSDLQKLAARLGADVPFCLLGGTALATGIGADLQPLPAPPDFWLVLVKPPFGISTGEAYRLLEPGKLKNRPDTSGMIAGIGQRDLKMMIDSMGNVLEPVATHLYPEVAAIKADLLAAGALGAQMSGSGPAVYGIFADACSAAEAGEELRRYYFRNQACSGYMLFVTKNRQEGIRLRRREGGSETAYTSET